MTIAIVGAGGQLGHAFVKALPDAPALKRSDLDITEEATVRNVLTRLSPDVVINCAAYTDVDGAESNPDLAFAVNGTAPGRLAMICSDLGIGLVTFSTDYVFDGTADRYVESDQTKPINIYGASKLEGERLVLASLPNALVIRTSWLISATHRNFVETILDLAANGSVKVVNDQWGRATCVDDLAQATLRSIEVGATGILHLANQGTLTWFELASRAATLAGMRAGVVEPCTTTEFPRPAPRPVRSVLESERLVELGVDPLPSIDESLPDIVIGLGYRRSSSR